MTEEGRRKKKEEKRKKKRNPNICNLGIGELNISD